MVSDLNTLYKSAPELHKAGINVISCDEKTGIQALEREKITPLKKGQCERQDSSYDRHGTQCLIANFEIATGKIISPTVGDSRTEEDFINHIKKTVETEPEATWIIILDQLNTHKSESLVRYVAQECNLKTDLGIKGKKGILANMDSRAKFLSDESHRIRCISSDLI